MNPEHDAAVIAASLCAVGFESVTLIDDATRDKMIGALRAFAKQASQADWTVVYYSGHGMEVFGTNFLVPVDARLAIDRDVAAQALALDQVMAAVDGAKKLKLVLLDACRTNPFLALMRRTASLDVGVASAAPTGGAIAVRSVDRGLAEIKVSGGTLVVYAAKHGQTALDGQNGNSPFAVTIVQRIAAPMSK